VLYRKRIVAHGVITLAQDGNVVNKVVKLKDFVKGISISLLTEEGLCFMQLDAQISPLLKSESYRSRV
jgi:hypothetical protein